MNRSSETNWLIVGLGNPGLRYEKTRHNLGFMLVDRLAREFQTQVKREECRSIIGRAEIENQTVELAKPHMQQLADETGETVHLGMMIDSEIIYVHKVDSRHMLGMYSRVGRRAPLHCTAIG